MAKLTSTETLGTCPHCGELVSLTVELTPESVKYHGDCPTHGNFVRTEKRLDMADLGIPVGSMVAFRGQEKSA